MAQHRRTPALVLVPDRHHLDSTDLEAVARRQAEGLADQGLEGDLETFDPGTKERDRGLPIHLLHLVYSLLGPGQITQGKAGMHQHFIGWLDDVNPDKLFASGKAWGLKIVRRRDD